MRIIRDLLVQEIPHQHAATSVSVLLHDANVSEALVYVDDAELGHVNL